MRRGDGSRACRAGVSARGTCRQACLPLAQHAMRQGGGEALLTIVSRKIVHPPERAALLSVRGGRAVRRVFPMDVERCPRIGHIPTFDSQRGSV